MNPAFRVGIVSLAIGLSVPTARAAEPAAPTTVALPAPALEGKVSVEEALATRRSHRQFADEPLTLAQAGQLLWAAQGVTEPKTGLRTAPSARGTYPLELYLVARRVRGLVPGVYRYVPAGHSLARVGDGALADATVVAAEQPAMKQAPALIVYVSVQERAKKLGDRADRMVAIDVGHAAENVYLQATALGLGTVTAAGFDQARVGKSMKLPAGRRAEIIQPVGPRP
jgi:SagB-type dehydrogenase family enzyme